MFRFAFMLVFTAVAGMASAKKDSAAPVGITPAKILVLGPVAQRRAGVVAADPVRAAMVAGSWRAPLVGESVVLADGTSKAWEEIAPGKDGAFEHTSLQGGYAYWGVTVDAPRVMLLETSGQGTVYTNGEPRTGDVYGFGYVRLPVLLHRGVNDFVFRSGRGQLSARLVEPDAPVALDVRDATLPDLRLGEAVNTEAAVVVVNATARRQTGLVLEALLSHGETARTTLPSVPPFSVRKVGFRIVGGPPRAVKDRKASLRLLAGPNAAPALHTATVDLRVRRPNETYKVTFTSGIDGSVQYYAVNPAQRRQGVAAVEKPAMVLTLHGASVEAIGQADAYAGKPWAVLVAPTNRRPYGYDWEDWGRLDALEVLDLARKRLNTDPERVYLVGHSMGGHGTWNLGVTRPDLFAAIAPSAGWISSSTYPNAAARPAHPSPMEAILQRANALGDTLSLVSNTAGEGVYILHGTADETVPVSEARTMADALSKFHKDFVFHEEPGQGHWWDLSDEPGADCVDWPPLFDFLARHAVAATETVRQVDFTTANPAAASQFRWARIESQQHAMQLSRVRLQCDPWKRRFSGTTENVLRLALDTRALMPGQTGALLELDGRKLSVPSIHADGWLHLRRAGNVWAVADAPSANEKNPRRYGPFRQAFDHHMLFVYGTRGTAEENAWAFAKARHDAEVFWYQGNGAVDVVADTDFDALKERDRGVVLYGNADTNAAWPALLGDSPVQAHQGRVEIGEHAVAGNDLACLFLRPRPGSDTACVAAVCGSGIIGMRLTADLPYLMPMNGFPDVLVVGSAALKTGIAGIRAAGFFGPDWAVPTGDFAWQDAGQPEPGH